MIFVFGSNLAGIHGAGAALDAARDLKFPYGLGVGRWDGAYAIPTKDCLLKPLPLKVIALYVGQFLTYAAENREDQFKVTQVGCGYAGFKAEQIAPMFFNAPPTCKFDLAWSRHLPTGTRFWGTFAAPKGQIP